MIRFKELRLKNFTRLKEATVKFSDDPKKPLTLIYGPNGSGKTTIMRAITWALHGTTNDAVFNTYKKLLNRDAEKKGDLNFSVTLIIENGDESIDIERSYNIKKGISEPKSENDFEETLSVTKNGDVEPSGNAQPEIEKLFPSELLDFYFFDGEDLGDYQDHMNNERNFIKNKIERVTKIPELIKLENCLNKVKDILDERLSNASEDTDLISDIGKLNTRINDNKEKKETAEGLIADFKEEIRKLESDFTDNDEETVDAIDKAEDKILELTKKLEEVKFKLLESTNNLWIFPIKKKLEKYRSKSKGIFSQVEHDQLASLLDYSSESKECPLCNRVHTKDTQEHIEKIIYELEDKKDKYNIKYKSILDKIENIDSDEDYLSLLKAKNTLEADLSIAKTNKREMNSILSDEEAKAKKGVLKSLKNYNKQLQKQEGIRDKAIDNLKELDPELRLKRRLQKTAIKNKKNKSKDEIISNLTYQVTDFVELFKSNLIEKTKNQVEKKANDIFQKIEQEGFHLKINDQYELRMFEENDDDEFGKSGAQNVFVALALITALKETASINGPMVIDTISLRVDKDNLLRLIDQFDDLSHQLTLIETNMMMELKDIKNALMKKSVHVYEAERKEIGISELLPHG